MPNPLHNIGKTYQLIRLVIRYGPERAQLARDTLRSIYRLIIKDTRKTKGK